MAAAAKEKDWVAIAEREFRKQNQDRVQSAQQLCHSAFKGDLPRLVNGANKKNKDCRRSENYDTPLIAAASGCSLNAPACVQHLLQLGACANKRNAKGKTAFMKAATRGNPASAKHLIAAGCDVNARSLKGKSAMDISQARCASSTEKLNKYRKVFLILKEKSTVPILGTAAEELARLAFADYDLPIEARPQFQLSYADVFKLKKFANKRNRDMKVTANGNTPLMSASASGSVNAPACVQHLLQLGASVSKRDEIGQTPLMIATNAGNAECVELLIAAGSDLEAEDIEGYTARDIAEAEVFEYEVQVRNQEQIMKMINKVNAK